MKVVRRIEEMRGLARRAKLKGLSIGFVPTMGALHAGHVSLIRACRKENDLAVVSVFVNPVQFGPREDFQKYPRDLKRDARICRREGVDILFCPDASSMYAASHRTFITVEGLSEVLCGIPRPSHFKGVATVVGKLLNIVLPDIVYFGQKDAQQSVVVRRMAEDLNFPVRIKVMPTVRERDGLAMSSRNLYLGREERQDASILYKALDAANQAVKRGERKASRVRNLIRGIIQKKRSVKIDYIEVVDMQELRPLDKIRNDTLIAVAARIGKTRLIDNIILKRA
jgi:pantoate--beta-alanine ligase